MAVATKAKAVSLPGNGVTLAGDFWASGGESSRPPVVFLHGGGQTRHSWDSSASWLAQQGWDAYTVDLRGHGDSGWSEDGTYSIEDYAADITSLVRSLGENPPVLVGASLGGLASLTAQSSNPDLACALILVDIVPRTTEHGVKRVMEFMIGNSDGFGDLEEAAAAISEYTGRKRRTNLEGVKKNVRQKSDGRWYWHWDPRMVQVNSDSADRGPDPTELLERASRIEVPVLIVRGGKSDVIDEAGVQELEGVLKNPFITVVGDARHMIAGDDNKGFAGAVDTFLNDVVLG